LQNLPGMLAGGMTSEDHSQHSDDRRTHCRAARCAINAQERLRSNMAQRIHENLAPKVIGALLRLQTVDQLQGDKPKRIQELFDTGLQLLTESVDESRRLMERLRPSILDDFGLVAAVEQMICRAVPDDKPAVVFQPSDCLPRLATSLELTAFRIIEESVANARRHSRGTRILLTLAIQDNQLCIEVRDWGIGFDPEAVPDHCLGLHELCHRAAVLGGRVEVVSVLGQGTRVTAWLPYLPAHGDR